MNVAFVLPYLAESFGGPVNVVRNLGQVLAQQGHDVSYWATVGERDPDKPVLRNSDHLYPVDKPYSWRYSRSFSAGLYDDTASLDIMHIGGLWLYPTYAASRIARIRERPYLLRPAGCLEPWSFRRGRLRHLKKKGYLWLVGRSIMNGAACLHACSTKEASHFRQTGYGGPIAIIPNGVDVSHFTDGDGAEAEEYWPRLKDRPVVLLMSRLSPEKGLDLVIPAWADLVRRPQGKEALLVLAGPDDRGYQKVVEGMIDKYGLLRHVFLTGMLTGVRKRAILRRADVFVLPSYSENFGNVVVEALACGTPVITTTGTPWQDLERIDAGRWVPPATDSLRDAMHEVLGMSESQRTMMGKRGIAFVHENYTWERVVDRFVHVCNGILEGRPISAYSAS